MTTKDDIQAKLDELANEVTNAREKLLKGEIAAIDNIQQRIEVQCQAIVELDPDDAIEIKPVLDDLLADLKLFSDEIDYIQAKVAEILANSKNSAGDKDPPEADN